MNTSGWPFIGRVRHQMPEDYVWYLQSVSAWETRLADHCDNVDVQYSRYFETGKQRVFLSRTGWTDELGYNRN